VEDGEAVAHRVEGGVRRARRGDSKTRMTSRNCGNSAGFSKLVAPFMGMAVRRANRKDLALLKQRLEAA